MPRETANFVARFRILTDELIKKIRSGEFVEGQQLPSERELGIAYSLSRQTVRRALELLAKEGWIVSRPGKGSFVAQKGEGSRELAPRSAPALQQIGLICRPSALAQRHFEDVVLGLTSVFSGQGYTLCLSVSVKDTQNHLYPLYRRWLEASAMDGYILASAPVAVQETIAQAGVRAISMGYLWSNLDLPSVATDYREVYRRAIHSLTEKNLLPCCGIIAREKNAEAHVFTNERMQGLQQGMLEKNLTGQQCVVAQCSDSAFDMVSCLRRVFAKNRRPKSLLLGSEKHLEVVFEFLEKQNLRVPEDIAIVVIEGAGVAPNLKAKINSFENNTLMLAQRAARKLLEVLTAGSTTPMHERYADGRFVGPNF